MRRRRFRPPRRVQSITVRSSRVRWLSLPRTRRRRGTRSIGTPGQELPAISCRRWRCRSRSSRIETIALDFAIAEIERQWQTREGGVNLLAEPAAGSIAADQNLSPPHRAPPAGLRPVTPVRFRPIGLAVGLPLGIIAIALAVGAYDGAALQSIIKGWGARWFPHTNVATGEETSAGPERSSRPALIGARSTARDRPPNLLRTYPGSSDPGRILNRAGPAAALGRGHWVPFRGVKRGR